MTEHEYDIRVADEDIRRRLVEQRKPWYDTAVLRYLHHEKKMSQAEIGRVFGVTQQSIQQTMAELKIEVRVGREQSSVVGRNQHLLTDFEDDEDQDGLARFV